MTESKRVPRDTKPKHINYIKGTLRCQRCATPWVVLDLNPERKAVDCPICGERNDIREAIGRAGC